MYLMLINSFKLIFFLFMIKSIYVTRVGSISVELSILFYAIFVKCKSG